MDKGPSAANDRSYHIARLVKAPPGQNYVIEGFTNLINWSLLQNLRRLDDSEVMGTGEELKIMPPAASPPWFGARGQSPPARRSATRVSGPPGAGGGRGVLQPNRAHRAVAVNATSPNIRWHITLAAPRPRLQRPPWRSFNKLLTRLGRSAFLGIAQQVLTASVVRGIVGRMKCIHCGSEAVVKNGCSRHGRQRWLCRACHKTSGEKDHRRVDPAKRASALAHYLKGVGLRATERLVGVSHNAVMNLGAGGGGRQGAGGGGARRGGVGGGR